MSAIMPIATILGSVVAAMLTCSFWMGNRAAKIDDIDGRTKSHERRLSYIEGHLGIRPNGGNY